jgi:hypothetical protein
LHSRLVALENRADAMDSVLVGLLKTLITSQSVLSGSDPGAESTSTPMQKLEDELQTMRQQSATLADIANSTGQDRDKTATGQAGFSTEEYRIGNLLRRLATFDEVVLTKPR